MPDEAQQPAETEKPKRTYKPRKPSVEHVVKAIKEGEYDEQIFEIRDAINSRMESKQQQVLHLVHEAFGDEAVVVTRKTTIDEATSTPPFPKPNHAPEEIITPKGGNPFIEKMSKLPTATSADLDALAERHPVLEAVVEANQGPYKVSPGDGNAYRVDTSVESPEGIVMITDVMGGHQVGVTQEEWDSWPDEKSQDTPMPGTTTVVEQNEFEKRGAVIAGLHPSDIADQ